MKISKRLGNHDYSKIIHINCQLLTPKLMWQLRMLGAMLTSRHYQHSKINHMDFLTLEFKIVWQVGIVLKHHHCSKINHMDYPPLIPKNSSGNAQKVSKSPSFIKSIPDAQYGPIRRIALIYYFHPTAKKAQPKSGNPNLTAPPSSMFTASNNRFTGEDGQSITRNMKIEEDAINRLKNPESRAKNFPRHVFRRIRPWAGCKISKEYINQDDLDQLPQWPTARRPFNPRVEVTTPVMNAPRRVSNSPPRPAPPAPQGPRRNPRRGCQNPQKTFGN